MKLKYFLTKLLLIYFSSLINNSPIFAAADDAYSKNDVLLFFQNPAGTTGRDQVVYFSLGSSTEVFREAATANSSTYGTTIPLGTINDILSATYGANWSGLSPTIHAGAAGQNGSTNAEATSIINGDYARTVYVTKPRNGAGTAGEANSASPLFDPAETSVAGFISGSNDIKNMTQPGAVGIADTILDSNNPFSKGSPTTAYQTLSGGIQGPIGQPVSYANLNAVLLLDLYRVTTTTGTNADSATLWHVANSVTATHSDNTYPGASGARADYLGTIALSANGDVNFVAKGWEEPMDPPSITSATTASGIVGTAFTYQIAASNGPTEFGATLSQASGAATVGLTVNGTTGIISGTPINAGVATIPISATNANGTGTASLILTIQESVGPTPTPTPTPSTGPAVTILDISDWVRPSWNRSLYSLGGSAGVQESTDSKASNKKKSKKSKTNSKSMDKKKGKRSKKKAR